MDNLMTQLMGRFEDSCQTDRCHTTRTHMHQHSP